MVSYPLLEPLLVVRPLIIYYKMHTKYSCLTSIIVAKYSKSVINILTTCAIGSTLAQLW